MYDERLPYDSWRRGGREIRMWTRGVPVEESAKQQLANVSQVPGVWPHVAVMPDVHLGYGATVGSVIPTRNVIIPAAVGVDIGCGMMAVRTDLRAEDLPDNLAAIRSDIEAAVPHGRTNNGGRGDKGAQGEGRSAVPAGAAWSLMQKEYEEIVERHPKAQAHNTWNHLGTLGGGNHFIELCLDENQDVWIMLHSGSRGVGNRIGTYFTQLAKQDMTGHIANLPAADLAYFEEGSPHFEDYCQAVSWAQRYAQRNRELMMTAVEVVLCKHFPTELVMVPRDAVVQCHHNYVSWEHHYGTDLIITRKGAVSAKRGELGIIPGSMGARSFIVRGLGNEAAFCSCSHGAGRIMSRSEAKRVLTLDDHVEATRGVECRKDAGVLDESPRAYKNIDDVMAAQADLVEIVHTLKQVLCVKG